MELGLFARKAVQGLYSFNHFEASNGMWIQTRVGSPVGKGNQAIFSYGADDPRPHVKFDRWIDLIAFVESL